jgi:peptide/nickel transport system permease protein
MGLTRYIASRVATALATIVVGCIVVFLVMKAAPGDPALAILGENATPEAVAAFRAAHNLDAPVLTQLATWFAGAVRGDLGMSLTIAGGRPIGDLIASRLPNTLFIGLFAVAIAAAVSLAMGTIAALRRGRLADTIATSAAVLGISMPDFWLSYMLVFAFALGLGWLPSYGFTSPVDSLPGAFYSGLLPAFAVAAPMAAVFARTLRTSLLGVAHQDHVIVAKSLGFRPVFIFIHWTFRNALIPYLTVIGLQIRYILGGVVVIERIFGVPGIGSLMVDAGFGRDYPVVQACTIVFLAIVLSVNLAVDLVCSVLDPRRTR